RRLQERVHAVPRARRPARRDQRRAGERGGADQRQADRGAEAGAGRGRLRDPGGVAARRAEALDGDPAGLMRALAITLVAPAACGGHDATKRPDAGVDAAVDAATGPDAPMCPVSTGFPAQLLLGPSSGSVANPFTVKITGSGSSQIGAVAFDADVGTVALGGAAQTSFLYMTVPFVGYQLYQGFAVGASRWDVFWMYCNGAALSNIYDEGVDGPLLFVEGATGSCNGAMTATTVPVTLPSSTIASPTPVDTGYAVDGTNIHIAANGIGTVTLGGATM